MFSRQASVVLGTVLSTMVTESKDAKAVAELFEASGLKLEEFIREKDRNADGYKAFSEKHVNILIFAF